MSGKLYEIVFSLWIQVLMECVPFINAGILHSVCVQFLYPTYTQGLRMNLQMDPGLMAEDLKRTKSISPKIPSLWLSWNKRTSCQNLSNKLFWGDNCSDRWKQAPIGSLQLPSWTVGASILLTLHTERYRVIGSQRDVLGLRCFHHDVLWQHNYALHLTSHGSPNHISCSSGSSVPAATVGLIEGEEGRGEDGGWVKLGAWS